MSPRVRRAVWQVRALVSAMAVTALVAFAATGTVSVDVENPRLRAAATPSGCVDPWEYHSLHEGMTRDRVARHVGSRGRHAEGWPGASRIYDTCGRSAWVVVRYGDHDRVRDYYRIGHD